MTAPKFTKNCTCDNYTNCTDCQKHDTAIRNATLDDVLTAMNVALANRSWTDTDGDYHRCPILIRSEIRGVIKSLRTKEQP
jgi:hypothetical protein